MDFGSGFWGPVVASAAILLGIAIGLIILLSSRKITPPKPTEEKVKIFAAGEELKPEEVSADSEAFYSAIRRVFGGFYKYVAPAHSGVLNTYLLWVMVGFIIILVAIWLVLR